MPCGGHCPSVGRVRLEGSRAAFGKTELRADQLLAPRMHVCKFDTVSRACNWMADVHGLALRYQPEVHHDE